MPTDDTIFALPSFQEAYTVTVRLIVAALMGAVIGWERETQNRAAGLRTHMLVAMGSALFVLAPVVVEMGSDQISRVMQGIIQGIGFLGAGAIIKYVDRPKIRGLTSAASIWATAAIGIAAGVGALWLPVVATLIVWVILSPVHKLEKYMKRKSDVRKPGK